MTLRTIQDLFVDRALQLERFGRSLAGGPRRIITITAGSGMGKSWLLRQFERVSQEQRARTCLIDFSDGQAYDVLTLARRFRDSLGAEHFNRLTTAINEATTPRLTLSDDGAAPASAFGSNNQLGNVSVGGDVAGRNIIRDNLFIIQADNPLLIQAVEDRVTQVFFECLEELTAQTRVVFLFDSYERTSLEGGDWVSNAADRWLTRELLTRLRDGRLSNTLVVLAGRRLPAFGAEWNAVIGRLPLDPFTEGDVGEYLRVNRGLGTLSDEQVRTLYNAVQGNPQLLGIIGDNLEQTTRPKDDEDW